MEEILHLLLVRCDPANIPDHIDVDVTALTIGHGLHVSDLKLAAGIEILDEPGQSLCTVSAPKAEEVVAPVAADGVAAAPDAALEPELIRKPKPEDEEGAEEEKKGEGKKAEGKKS
jgi:large subunit ribosomal protein L25